MKVGQLEEEEYYKYAHDGKNFYVFRKGYVQGINVGHQTYASSGLLFHHNTEEYLLASPQDIADLEASIKANKFTKGIITPSTYDIFN